MAEAHDTVEVLISVDDAHLDSFATVVEQLGEAGLEVAETMPGLGTVSGSVDANHVADVASIEGVEAVERSHEVRLAPPHAPVQ